MARILIVDDDEQVLKSISRILKSENHELDLASSGQQALDLLARVVPDAIILDIVMPEMDGIELCRRIRANPFTASVPILFLTAKGRPDDVIEGFDAGGDDYLTKPFEVVELPARLRSLLRRAPGGALNVEADFLVAGKLRLHATRPQLYVGDDLIELTVVEHRLLHFLMLNAGKPVSTARLLEDVWEYPPGAGDPELAQTHIGNLRAKIEPDPEMPQYLLDAPDHSYVINPQA